MAKGKGGLGRGLSSLLGVSTEEENNSTTTDSTDKNVTSESTLDELSVVAQTQEDTEINGRQDNTNKSTETSHAIAETNKSLSDLSSSEEKINEENITIKGVVERPVTPSPSQPTTPLPARNQKSEGQQEKDYAEVELSLIHPNPDQPRTNFKKEELEELAESIKRNGLLQPILVRNAGDGSYQIIAGERRWQACNLLHLDKVPVRIKDVDDDETIMLALVENIQRSDLNPIEEAYGYRRMMERGKMTQSEVAQAVSKGRSTIANALRLLELPEDAQQLLFEEKITAGHARAVLSIPTQDGRRKLTEKLVEKQLSVRETENLARLLAGKKDKQTTEKTQPPKSYKTVARALRDALDTEVKIKSVKGKNKIEIEFKDEADLERLFRKFTA